MCTDSRDRPRPARPEEHALSSIATTVVLAASGTDSGGFHAPTLADFFPPAIFFEGTPFEFNRITLVRIIAVAAVSAVLILAARRARLVPGRFQSVIELLLDFVRVNIVQEALGKERAATYVPMITTIFVGILAFNLTGLIPGLNMAGTAAFGLPLLLALWVCVRYIGAGIRQHGVGGYFKLSLFPAGAPKFMYILLTPIEILQVFVVRPASLAIRLMANMVAGHIMLVLCFAATNYFVMEAVPAMKAFGALTLVGGLIFTLFELLVAALQAYIFALLAAVYIQLSVDTEH